MVIKCEILVYIRLLPVLFAFAILIRAHKNR